MVSCLMGDSTALASAIVRCCLKTPYMGINECVARFKPVDFTNLHPEMGNGVTRDIGWMFFDYDYTQVNEKKSFAPTPMFQLVRMENGLIDFTKGAIRRDSSFA